MIILVGDGMGITSNTLSRMFKVNKEVRVTHFIFSHKTFFLSGSESRANGRRGGIGLGDDARHRLIQGPFTLSKFVFMS